jgi:hypothetical protein
VFFSREIEREQNKKTVGVCFLDEVSREKRRDRQIKERKKKKLHRLCENFNHKRRRNYAVLVTAGDREGW